MTIDYHKYFSQRTLRRKPSAIRKLAPLMAAPGMISLAGGLPNPNCFPFTKLEVGLGKREIEIEGDQLKQGLQYQPTPGVPSLLGNLVNRMKRDHVGLGEHYDFGCTVGVGSQDLMSKVFDMLLNPGEVLLVEDPTYSGALAALAPIGCELAGVTTDVEGIQPEDLRRALRENPGAKVLYTIPTGQNPSGVTTTTERRQEVYKIAQEHDLLIIEDDPYYYLYLDQDTTPLPRSYISMDTDGRVLRLDSLSKIISSGMRVGWASGHPDLMSQLQLDLQGSCLHAPAMNQVILHELFEQWGEDGWEEHIEKAQGFYRKQRDMLQSACEKHLTGLAEWSRPSGGMFLWLKLKGVKDTREMIEVRAKNEGVLFVPGAAFAPTFDSESVESPYVRASYSLVNEENANTAMERLAQLMAPVI